MTTHMSQISPCADAARRRASRLRAVLLATSALASAALGTAAHAADATWLPNPQDASFNNPLNWAGGATPNGTASFGTSANTNVTFDATQNVGTLQLNNGSSNYNFTVAAGILTLTGGGIVIQPGAGTATFTVQTELDFTGSSKAANATITNNGLLGFLAGSSADHASVTNGRSFYHL
jgi:hypothetical protein